MTINRNRYYAFVTFLLVAICVILFNLVTATS